MLDVEGLTVHFGGLIAVNNVTFTVKTNEILSIIGPNGAGKTTIFNTITGFCHPDKGRVIFKGEDVTGLKPHEVAKRGIGRTFQKTNVFREMTVLENVVTASDRTFQSGFWDILIYSSLVRREERACRDRAMQILAFCGIDNRSEVLVKNLSYGEQRLVEIAICLGVEPELLLIDEPAAGLNPVETQTLMALIRKIRKRGQTILLVEHDMTVVMGISDRIEVLDFGLQIASGRPQEVAENETVIKAYLGSRGLRHQSPLGRDGDGGESKSGQKEEGRGG